MKLRLVALFSTSVLILASCKPGGGGSGPSGNGPGPKPEPVNPLPPGKVPDDYVPKTRFGVVNGCKTTPIWIQQDDKYHIGGTSPVVKLPPNSAVDYDIPDAGFASFRAWPKLGCDSNGDNCAIGQSSQNSDGNCPSGGCQPDFNSKFEATFGCRLSDPNACALNPSDTSQHLGPETSFDGSAVDGFTLPFKINVIQSGQDKTNPQECTNVDASSLDLKSCPTDNLSTPSNPFGFGPFTTYHYYHDDHIDDRTCDLTKINLAYPISSTGKDIQACASPGTLLTAAPPWGCALGKDDNAATDNDPTNDPKTWLLNGKKLGATYDDRSIMYANPYNENVRATVSAGDKIPNGLAKIQAYCAGHTDTCADDVGIKNGKTGPAKVGALGPIVNTNYVKYIHGATTPTGSVYAWQYDDVNALRKCESPDTKIVFIVLCQDGK